MPAGAAERREAALGRDAGAREHGERAAGEEIRDERREASEAVGAHGASPGTMRSRPREWKSSGIAKSAPSAAAPFRAARFESRRVIVCRVSTGGRGGSVLDGMPACSDTAFDVTSSATGHGQARELRELGVERLGRRAARGDEARETVERRARGRLVDGLDRAP